MACILVIEDDPNISRTLNFILNSWGWEPTMKTTLESGLLSIQEGQFNHLILDLMLPDGDGSIVLKYIFDNNLPISTIVASAVGDQREQELYSLGAKKVLTKPYVMAALQEALESI